MAFVFKFSSAYSIRNTYIFILLFSWSPLSRTCFFATKFCPASLQDMFIYFPSAAPLKSLTRKFLFKPARSIYHMPKDPAAPTLKRRSITRKNKKYVIKPCIFKTIFSPIHFMEWVQFPMVWFFRTHASCRLPIQQILRFRGHSTRVWFHFFRLKMALYTFALIEHDIAPLSS